PWAALAAGGLERARTAFVRALAGAAICVLGVLTFQQCRVWRDSFTLWDRALAVDPGNYVAYTNRGWAHQLAGDIAAPLADYDRALAIRDDYATALFDRGTARYAAGDFAGALADYEATLRADPGDLRALANRGWARRALGDRAGAIDDYARALSAAPADWP